LRTAAPSSSLYNGLLANYKLDETSGTTAIDETGNHNGIINGTPALGVAANLGTGYNFSVDTASFTDTQTKLLIGGRSAFTIAGWVKVSTGTTMGSLYGAWSGSRICSFGNNTVTTRWINYIYIGGELKGGVFDPPAEGWGVNTDFRFMICTYDGTTLRTTVNNKESLNSYAMTGIVQSPANCETERIGNTSWQPSKLIVSSLQIWDRAITTEEKTNLWNGGSGIIL